MGKGKAGEVHPKIDGLPFAEPADRREILGKTNGHGKGHIHFSGFSLFVTGKMVVPKEEKLGYEKSGRKPPVSVEQSLVGVPEEEGNNAAEDQRNEGTGATRPGST